MIYWFYLFMRILGEKMICIVFESWKSCYIANLENIFLLFWFLGYLEDRRPASNMDPYVVTALLAETTLLWEPTLEAEALAAQKISLKV